MYLLELPPEILGMILKHLDLTSKLRAWNACSQLRCLLRRPEDARRLSLARRPRLRRALDSSYFREIAPYVLELDLSGLNLQDADTEPLKRMRNLRSLDVSHTRMPFRAVADVCSACPRLTRLHADFMTEFISAEEERGYNAGCINLQNLKYIHFFTSFWKEVILEVVGAKVRELEISCAFYYDGLIEDLHIHYFMCVAPRVKMIRINLDSNVKHRRIINRLISFVTQWEFLVTTTVSSLPRVYLSANLHREARKAAVAYSYKLLTAHDPILDEVSSFSLFAWHCSLIEQNPNFYIDILLEIDLRTPQNVCRQDPETLNTDCYFLSSCTFAADSGIDININAFVKNKDDIKVSYSKMCECPNAPSRCDTIESHNLAVLKNIVFFSVTDLDLSSEFCKELFKNCNRLETVQIRRHSAKLIENIGYSRSVKNIRIIDDINESSCNLKEIFYQLSKCNSLENVHTYDTTDLNHNIPYTCKPPLQRHIMLPFFRNCPNLCNLYICMHNKFNSNIVRAQYRVVKKIRIELNRPDIFFSFDTHATVEDHEEHYHEPHRIYFEAFSLRNLKMFSKPCYEASD